MNVFFYGLFMDEQLLASKGIVPSAVSLGYVEGYRLRIGERATLLPSVGSRAYGAIMEITAEAASDLYAEDSVADYEPEPVTVELLDGTHVEAVCYNLPSHKVAGANQAYAASLFEVAKRLGFPEPYLEQIRTAGGES